MSETWRRIGTVGVAAALIMWLAAPSGSRSAAPSGSGTFRLLRTIRFDYPVVECHGDGVFDCVETSAQPESFDLSSAASSLDIAMTVTISYRTTRHDPAVLYATLRPKLESRLMKPGRLSLRPTTTTTTTTLRWTADDLPPDLYRLGFQIEYGRAAELPLRIWAPKMTVLLEAWEGGV